MAWINWEKYKDKDGIIDLVSAYVSHCRTLERLISGAAIEFLLDVMALEDITNTEAAAIALAFALDKK